MKQKIELSRHAVLQSVFELALEMHQSFPLAELWFECFFEMFNVLDAGNFRKPRVHHHQEEGDEDAAFSMQGKVRLLTVVTEPETKKIVPEIKKLQ